MKKDKFQVVDGEKNTIGLFCHKGT